MSQVYQCDESGAYETRQPKKDKIEKLNALEGIIVLFTARLETDRQKTEKWLKKNDVRYHSLIMEKIPYHSFIDDRAKGDI